MIPKSADFSDKIMRLNQIIRARVLIQSERIALYGRVTRRSVRLMRPPFFRSVDVSG